ncbi:MAG: hypothetical protein WCF94_00445 [bacterium]
MKERIGLDKASRQEPEPKSLIPPADVHPLMWEKPILPIANWYDWLKRFERARQDGCINDISSRIFDGFTVPISRLDWREPEFTYMDRIIFYLRLTEGRLVNYDFPDGKNIIDQNDYKVYWMEDDKQVSKSISKIKASLAEKAFNQLCQNFFKDRELYVDRNRFAEFWFSLLEENFYPHLKSFLRTEKGVAKNLRWSGKNSEKLSHNEEIMCDFLRKFTVFLWKWSANDDRWRSLQERYEIAERKSAFQQRIRETRIWMLELLADIRMLDVFDDNEKLLAKLSRNHIKVLRQVVEEAARQRTEDDDDVPINNGMSITEESFAHGSPSARLIIRWEILRKIRLAELIDTEINLSNKQERIAEIHFVLPRRPRQKLKPTLTH